MEQRELECKKKAMARKKAVGIYKDESYKPTEYAQEVFRRKPYPTFGRPATEVD